MKCKGALVCCAVRRLLTSFLLLIALATALTVPVEAQTTATTTPIAYARPSAGMLQAGDQNFYAPSQPILESCTTDLSQVCSYVYKMTPDGTTSILHSFPQLSNSANPPVNAEGVQPTALIVGTDGNLYGTCQLGGPGGFGTIFRIDLAGNPTLLESFGVTGNAIDPGSQPLSLIQAADGSFYFTNSLGIYQLTVSGNNSDREYVYTFPFSESAQHQWGWCILDSSGRRWELLSHATDRAADGAGRRDAGRDRPVNAGWRIERHPYSRRRRQRGRPTTGALDGRS